MKDETPPLPRDDPAESCDTLVPLVDAYALGERNPALLARLDAHLRTCVACTAVLADAQRVAQVLPLAASDAVPSPDLRARVLAAVDAAAQQRAVPGPHGRGARTRSVLPPARLLRYGSAVLLVALLGWNVVLQRTLGQQQQHTAVLAEALQAAGAARVALAAAPAAPAARGTVLLLVERQTLALAVDGMPPLLPDQVYQLWLIDNDQRTSGGVFRVDDAGRGVLVVQAPRRLDVYDAVGVTIEPAGGSAAPTTPRVIGGPLS